MSDIYVIAASGMAASAAWLNAIASNVANARGSAALSNVDLTTVIVDQTIALQCYRADAAALKTAGQMTWSVINTIA